MAGEEYSEVGGHVPGCRVSFEEQSRQGPQANPFQGLGDAEIMLARWSCVRVGDQVEQLEAGLLSVLTGGDERPSACQQLEENHAQAEDVRATIHVVSFTRGLLGAHVGGCTPDSGSAAEIFLPEAPARNRQGTPCPRHRARCWRA